MMAGTVSKGNCYLCGETIAKSAFKKHALTAHLYSGDDQQQCMVLKAEGADQEEYWLYLDLPVSATLKMLDSFLREIWCECCGHLSAFFMGCGQVGKGRKIGEFPVGTVLRYEYDFGTTTELLITIVGESMRAKQRKAVRLIGRNEPFHFTCCGCGAEADFICCECMWEQDNPFFCEDCLNKHEHEYALPVVNSPRMGECGYSGELDVYEFAPNADKQ